MCCKGTAGAFIALKPARMVRRLDSLKLIRPGPSGTGDMSGILVLENFFVCFAPEHGHPFPISTTQQTSWVLLWGTVTSAFLSYNAQTHQL